MRTALIKDKAILKRIQTFDPNFNAALDPIGQASTGQAASSSSLSSQAPLIQE
jgi:hypothetical protein